MKKLPRGNIYRTTFDQVFEDEFLPAVGIYVIAYMGTVLYVGKASSSIAGRMENHLGRNKSIIGYWLNLMEFDWHNVRLDIIEPPTYEANKTWFEVAENACIKRFTPLFNKQLMPEKGVDFSEVIESLVAQLPPIPEAVSHETHMR